MDSLDIIGVICAIAALIDSSIYIMNYLTASHEVPKLIVPVLSQQAAGN